MIKSDEKTIFGNINCAKQCSGFIEREMLSEVTDLLRLHLLSPARNTVKQRSASTMQSIRNWLSSTVTQERLSQTIRLSIYRKVQANWTLLILQVFFVTEMTRDSAFLVYSAKKNEKLA